MLLGSPFTYAGAGKATAPHFQVYKDSSLNETATTVMITNITNHAIKVSVFFYGKDGTLLPSTYMSYNNFTNSNTEIAANNSAYIYLTAPTNIAINYGKISIEWANLAGADDTVALLAHSYVYTYYNAKETATRFSVPINNGMPF